MNYVFREFQHFGGRYSALLSYDRCMFKRFGNEKPIPDSSGYLWRYIGMAAFLSLLQRSELFFAPLNTFQDPFEGIHPQITNVRLILDRVRQVISQFRARQEHQNAPDENQAALAPFMSPGDGHVEPAFAELEMVAEQLTNALRNEIFVSCWHLNRSESAGMWTLYAGTRGIAIRTTPSGFRRSLVTESNLDIGIGRVRYVDEVYWSEPDLFLKLKRMKPAKLMQFWVLLKRSCFEYEREVRAFVLGNQSACSGGVYVKVDLHALIDRVYLSPESPPWVAEVIRTELVAHKVAAPVFHSSVFQDPSQRPV